MRILLFLSVLALFYVAVFARRHVRSRDDSDENVETTPDSDRRGERRYKGHRFGGEGDYRRGDGDRLGRDDGHRRWNRRWGAEGDDKYKISYHGSRFGGHHGHRGRNEKLWRNCACRTQCDGNTGEKIIGCWTNRTSYIQCQDATCSLQSCPEGQLFNHTTSACVACPSGFHVDATQRRCVCNEGTTFDFRSRTCGPCPTGPGATVTPDKCYCDGSVHDKSDNTCKLCPAGTTKTRRGCSCNDRKEFWSWQTFSCQACPGEWVSRSEGRRRPRTVEVCECQGEKEIFNKWSVSCIRCPENSIVATKWGKSYCDCTEIGQRYDWKTNSCLNRTAEDDNDADDDDNNGDDNDAVE